MRRFILRSIIKPLGFNLSFYLQRPFNRFIKNSNKEELIGVEIGVLDGWNALEMLEMLPIKKLYLIDPYIAYKEYGESQNNPKKNQIEY